MYGRSLGSGPSCFLAQKTAKEGKSVGGVILQSPLLSAYRVAFDFRFTMVADKVCSSSLRDNDICIYISLSFRSTGFNNFMLIPFLFTILYNPGNADFVLSQFPNIDYAPNIKCPVFIVHGTQDEVVPFWHGEDLFMALPQQWRAKPFWVDSAGHNNIEALLRPTGAFVDKVIEFLDLHISARRGKVAAARPVPECVPLAIREMNANAGIST